LSNADLEQMVDTSDEWIRTRTGIQERRLIATGERLSDLAVAAGKECLEQADCDPSTVDGIILATSTADQSMPATANLIQHRLGISGAWGFDLVNACNGFVAALATAAAFIESGRCKRILLLAGDVMSPYLDFTDRNTCILFGDGCGAVLLEAGVPDGPGIIDVIMHSDGAHGDLLQIPCSGSAMPATAEVLADGQQYLKQDGRQVFSHAVRRMAEACDEILERVGVGHEAIDLLVPHQANIRIMDAVARRLNLPKERMVANIHRLGNTTAGTVPLALRDAADDGRLVSGSRVLVTTFGAGFAWGAAYLTWGRP
jgi:3-oxoacyl-[acyl-carrier-protein] synthase-3